VIINGANPAEAHPVGFQWFLKAKLDPKRGIGQGGGAKMIHIDPRFTRTSAVSDVYARIRTGTDTAFFGRPIHYVLDKKLIHPHPLAPARASTPTRRSWSRTGSASTRGCSAATTPRSARTTPRRGPTRATPPARPRSSAPRRWRPRPRRRDWPIPARCPRAPPP